MADAVISALVDQFVSRSLQKIEEEVRLVKNAKTDVKKLKKSLRLIQALLEDAGKKQIESASVRQWLSDLEEASYDMDDVLDEWNAAILKSEIEKEAAGQGSHDEQKKVSFPMPSACFCFKQKVKEVISLRDFAKRIKELNEELDRTKKEGNDLGIVARAIEPSHQEKATTSSSSKRKITSSFVDETEVHGRDQDKAVLVSKLLCESGSKKGRGVDVIPVVGMGGLGKTTLAQITYNDDSIKAHFDKRIWVCVSDPFDLIKIARAIVEGLGGNPQSYGELEALLQFISESVRGKKFLLVLDDVWSKDRERWEQLYQPLKYGAPGSRILVTTRNKEVAMMMGASAHMISTLSDEQCWSIIKQRAFAEEESKEFIQLEVVGKGIASKCKGLPLTAKIIGSHMCYNKSKTQWEEILRSQLWEPRADDEIFDPFLLSYYDLSASEKCCFSYCSVFPKDYKIKRDILIEMWMSQGYFNDSSKGQDCFESLARRSFFQEFEINEDDGSIDCCKMHDIVHDFAKYLTRDKCVIMEGRTSGEQGSPLDDKARHLIVVVKSSSQQLPESKEYNSTMQVGKRLRTLLVELADDVKLVKLADDDKFGLPYNLSLQGLRTLSMQWLKETMIKKLSNFIMSIHLRYLDLSYSYGLEELPDSVCDLSNLQTLKLIDCQSLKRLPERFEKLVNLRHLYIYECWKLEWLPKGLGKLTSLQKLDMLVVPNNRDEYFNTEDLKRLKCLQLQGLRCIYQYGNLRIAGEAEEINLTNTEDLLQLDLNFNNYSIREEQVQNGRCEREAMILEALKPHPSLKSLKISMYNGITLSPSWMTSLTSLRSLDLVLCDNCEILPPLGKLPSLEILKIGGMRRVKKVGVELLGVRDGRESEEKDGLAFQSPFISFPRLKHLRCEAMHEWKEWEGIQGQAMGSSFEVMPSLRSLELSYCFELEALPDFLRMTPLHKLDISFCFILAECIEKRVGKEWLKVCNHIPNIQIDFKDVKRDGEWIPKRSHDDDVPESSSTVAE